MQLLSDSRGLGFGGFLIGIGAGWIIFTNYSIDSNLFSYLIILLGLSIIVSSILPHLLPDLRIGGLFSGLVIGMIVAIVINTGFSILPWSNSYPYSEEGYKNFTDSVVADNILFETLNINGQIHIESWEENQYKVSAKVIAKGRTVSDAESNFNKVDIQLNDDLNSGVQELELEITIPQTLRNRINIDITVYVPSDSIMDVDVSTTNGGIITENINGGDFYLETTNGDLVFYDVTADVIDGDTTNGGIRGTTQSSDFYGKTTNGGISLTLPSTESGSYNLRTTNGNVNVIVSQNAETGFDLDCSLSNGNLVFDLDDLSYTEQTSKSKDATTQNWDIASVQIEIDASTTNGNINIGD